MKGGGCLLLHVMKMERVCFIINNTVEVSVKYSGGYFLYGGDDLYWGLQEGGGLSRLQCSWWCCFLTLI